MNLKIKLGFSFFIIILLTLGGCKKDLNVIDENNPTTQTYFKTALELQKGLNAAYSTLRSGHLTAREWFYLHDMRGSEMAAGGAQLEAPRAELLRQPSPSPSNSVMTAVWDACYVLINRANLVISKGPEVKDDEALRDETIGEAKFLRAWAYFELVSQWGEVPLYTKPVISSRDFKGLASTDDLYSQIVSDLTDATAVLPETPAQLGRATKYAAFALLGRVQMQKGDYNAAKTALLKVYGKFSLVPFLYNFDGDVKVGSRELATGHEFNSESIFEVVFVDKGDGQFDWAGTGEGVNSPASEIRAQEYGINWGNIIPSNSTLEEFEPNDPRYRYTFYEAGDQILTYGGDKPGRELQAEEMNVNASSRNGSIKKRIYRKYAILDWTDDKAAHPDGLNHRYIRYSGVLLMLAECEAETGAPAQAAKYINEVRTRPGIDMPPVVLNTKKEAIAAVMHERGVELAGEEVNNIDMLRWRKQGYYPSIRPDPKPDQVDFLPIPAEETSSNPNIK